MLEGRLKRVFGLGLGNQFGVKMKGEVQPKS
jgi:hypothetical protein